MGNPYDGPYGKDPPERGIFSMLQVYERVGVSMIEVCNLLHTALHAVWEKDQKGLTDIF